MERFFNLGSIGIEMRLSLIFLSALSSLSGCSRNNPTVPPIKNSNAFAIYFLKDTTLTIKDIVNADLKDLKLGDKPWLTQDDIEFYDWSSHCIYLKKDKSYFFPNCPSFFQGSWVNKPFVAVANGHKCYTGYFLSMISNDMLPNPDIFDADVLFYPSDIIHIEWPYPFANDKRDNDKIRSSLIESNLLHEGLGIAIDSLWISNGDTATVRYEITINNKDRDDLYVLDPDKMGTELFHAFANGPVFYNTDNKIMYESVYKKVTVPSPLNSYDAMWFIKIESGKSIIRAITLKGYAYLPTGDYYCRFGFANPTSIGKKDRVLPDGRYWMGFTQSDLIGFRLDSGTTSPKLKVLSQTQQVEFMKNARLK